MDERMQYKETTDFVKEERLGNFFKGLLEGKVFANKLKRNKLFVVFVAILGILYIANGYKMEKLHIERSSLESEVRDLRFESVTAAADLMFIRKQSEVVKRIKEEGLSLEESKEPPMKLYK